MTLSKEDLTDNRAKRSWIGLLAHPPDVGHDATESLPAVHLQGACKLSRADAVKSPNSTVVNQCGDRDFSDFPFWRFTHSFKLAFCERGNE